MRQRDTARLTRGSLRQDTRTPTDPTYLRYLFNKSAGHYERVSMLTSAGQVGRWRREAIRAAHLRPTDKVLDAFCGPGGLAEQALTRLDGRADLVLVDLSPVMLDQARVRMEKRASNGAAGSQPTVKYVAGDLVRDDLGLAEFDVMLAGWGLRYVDDVHAALTRMKTFLRAEGRIVLLEFTPPPSAGWAAPAHYYFRHILPTVGSWLARDAEPYEYLRVSCAGLLSRGQLECALEQAGFSVIYRRTYLRGLVTVLTAVALPLGEGDQ